MKKSVKIQFYDLIFLNQQVRLTPATKPGVNGSTPIRQGIRYFSSVSFKIFSASFYDHPKNLVGKVFLLHLIQRISYAFLPIKLRQKIAELNEGNLTASRFSALCYG